MEINIQLIAHNIISISTGIMMIGAGIFVLLHNIHHRANICFALASFSAAIFTFSHVAGVSVADPETSRAILMFNLSTFSIGIFSLHMVIAFLDKDKELKTSLGAVYISGIALTLFFIVFPDLFLVDSVSKMYFPNYYAPGPLYWVSTAWLYLIAVPFLLYELASSYFSTESILERQKQKYFFLAILTAFTFGFLPNLLVHNVQFNPLWGMLFGAPFFGLFLYGAVVYKVLSVQVIAKRAFLYAALVAVIGGIIVILNASDHWIQLAYPAFPRWIVPLASSIITVTVTAFVWQAIRTGETLKYEFINVVTHRFRTPLTYIKWSTEALKNAKSDEERVRDIVKIETASNRLVELTSALLNLTKEDEADYTYKKERTTFKKIVEPVLELVKKDSPKKDLRIECVYHSERPIIVDIKRMQSALQILIENAMTYSLEGGLIEIKTIDRGRYCIFSITDHGIGITKSELPFIFNQFYRTPIATNANIDGLGLGLYFAKNIVKRHGGTITVESQGKKTATTFTISLKAV